MGTSEWQAYIVILSMVTIVFLVLLIVLRSMRQADEKMGRLKGEFLATGKIPPPCSFCRSHRIDILEISEGEVARLRCLDCDEVTEV